MSARDEIRFAVDALRRLPWPVARFVVRARSLARRDGDVFSLDSALRPAKLEVLLEAATGRRAVVELGTGTAWATIALAIADPERTIESWDPVVREQRERYLALAGPDVRRRISFVEGLGEDGPGAVAGVDPLFIDSSHEREPTLAEVYPGVAEAVDELGAVGQASASLYLWRTG